MIENMLTVKTSIKQSAIHGTGVFAAEDIAKGTIVWKYEPLLDIGLTKEQMQALPDIAKKTFLNYAYHDAEDGLYILCFDDARFMNHADDPNTTQIPNDIDTQGYTVATKDIKAGEEITCDYRIVDDDIADKLGPAFTA